MNKPSDTLLMKVEALEMFGIISCFRSQMDFFRKGLETMDRCFHCYESNVFAL